MANYVQIAGLQRGNATRYKSASASGTLLAPGYTAGVFAGGEDGPASVHGFRVPLALGRHYSSDPAAQRARLTTASGVVVYANNAGTYGNNIKVSLATGSTAAVATSYALNGATLEATVAITLPAGATGRALTDAIDGDPTASQLVTAYVANTTSGTLLPNFSATALTGGTNGTRNDAEPPYGVAGEPLWFNVTDRTLAVVDTQNRQAQRSLQRNNWRFISLGKVT